MSRRDDDLAERLDALEDSIERLRGDLRSDTVRGPPTPRDLLRFTEEYTIPTVVAVLEATVRSLELLQRLLRLADPERAAREETARARGSIDRRRTEALDTVASVLRELETVIEGSELPADAAARDVLTQARDLTADIESRVADAERDRRQRAADWRERERATDRGRAREDDERDRDHTGREPVTIEVVDERDDGDEGDGTSPIDADRTGDTDDEATVDVDAELQSIKDELGVHEVDEADGDRPDVDEADTDDDRPDVDEAGADGEESETD